MMVRKIAVRKVLRIARELHFVSTIVVALFILAAMGFVLYLAHMLSSAVLFVKDIPLFSFMITSKIAIQELCSTTHVMKYLD